MDEHVDLDINRKYEQDTAQNQVNANITRVELHLESTKEYHQCDYYKIRRNLTMPT